MKLETIRNRPYYLKTGPSELAKTKIMAKFFSEKTEDMDVEKLMLFKQLNEGRFDPAEIMQYHMMSTAFKILLVMLLMMKMLSQRNRSLNLKVH